MSFILTFYVIFFTKVNGFSNRYYGWGIEDAEFYVRIPYLTLEMTFL